MSRLYDRLVSGCPPFRLTELLAGTPFEERLGQLLGKGDPDLAQELAARDLGRLSLRTANPTGRSPCPSTCSRGAPVIAMDNVLFALEWGKAQVGRLGFRDRLLALPSPCCLFLLVWG